jgi:hypothetical protein
MLSASGGFCSSAVSLSVNWLKLPSISVMVRGAPLTVRNTIVIRLLLEKMKSTANQRE